MDIRDSLKVGKRAQPLGGVLLCERSSGKSFPQHIQRLERSFPLCRARFRDQFAGRGHDLVSRAWFRFGHEAIVVSTHSSCQEENHRAGRAARQVASGSGGRPKVADPPARRVAFSNDSAEVNPKTWLGDGT